MVPRAQVGLIGALPLCIGLSMPLTLSVTESFCRNSPRLSVVFYTLLSTSKRRGACLLDTHAQTNCARSWKTTAHGFQWAGPQPAPGAGGFFILSSGKGV